jgi:hypothetical protein
MTIHIHDVCCIFGSKASCILHVFSTFLCKYVTIIPQ